MRKGEVDYVEDYEQGVEIAEERLYELVNTLKNMGVYENTLVVFTSDHGEAFPEDERQGIIHNVQCPEVVNIKTTFFEENISIDEPLLSKNIVRIWKPEWDKIKSDLSNN